MKDTCCLFEPEIAVFDDCQPQFDLPALTEEQEAALRTTVATTPAEEFGAVRFSGDAFAAMTGHPYRVILADGKYLQASGVGMKKYRGDVIGVNHWGVTIDPVMTFKTAEAAFAARDKAFKLSLKGQDK